MTTVAVMQPYFYPYAGYYRLMAQASYFVIYDCVQFIRRGWIHRNYFTLASGDLGWLTLPLKKAPQAALIKDMVFDPIKKAMFYEEVARFPLLDVKNRNCPAHAAPLLQQLREVEGPLVPYLSWQLENIAGFLGLTPTFLFSSQVLSPRHQHLRGEERILAICKTLGATRYLNAPGGRGLYTPKRFAQEGVVLEFLPPWPGLTQRDDNASSGEGGEGSYTSILEDLIRGILSSPGQQASAGSP